MKNLFRIVVLFLAASFASARNPKMGPDLEGIDPGSNVDVIIQFKHIRTEEQDQRVRSQGGILKTQFEMLRGGLYTVPASALEWLANDPDVAYISPDRKVGGLLDLTADAVNASAAWGEKLNGAGIGIAIIDSGISNHPDLWYGLSSRVVYNMDLVGGGPADLYGHGTHVAGILAGDGAMSTCLTCTRTFKGMAPNAKLVNLRVLDQNGQGSDSKVISAIDQAISLKATYNVRVINLSLGRPVFESYTLDPLCQAVEAAWNAGIVVVVAAGNDGRDNSAGNNGYGTIEAPGNDPDVITVGAMKTMGTPTRNDDLIASYSSKGPTVIDHVVKPDLVAPGNLVVSLLASGTDTLPTSYSKTLIPLSYFMDWVGSWTSTLYFRLSGTSMAAPVVSGAAALILQAHPSLTPDQLKARLMRSAYKTFPPTSQATDPVTGQVYVSQYDVFTVGAGYLDIQAALADTNIATGNTLSPTATYNSATGNANLVFAPGSVWGDGTIWGVSTVWGQGVVNSTGTLWGQNAIWGQSGAEAFGTIWGTGTIWGQTSAEAASIEVDGEN